MLILKFLFFYFFYFFVEKMEICPLNYRHLLTMATFMGPNNFVISNKFDCICKLGLEVLTIAKIWIPTKTETKMRPKHVETKCWHFERLVKIIETCQLLSDFRKFSPGVANLFY